MRGIIELILGISLLAGGGYKALDMALYVLKEAAAKKILEQPRRSLSESTRVMTGNELSDSPGRLLVNKKTRKRP